ncbi:hypothetical protein [Tardiphaga sp.]|uniref:hypothetical protein n=1 Tax=Tardiphaga sp. TaxID=1926292 RepID=UPI00352B6655
MVAIMCAGLGGPIGAWPITAKYGEKQCRPTPKGWQKHGSEFGELMTVNLLEARDGRLFWNKAALSTQTLRRYLTEVRRLNPMPNMVLVVSPHALCSEVNSLRRLISSNLQCGAGNACVEYSSLAWKSAQPPPWHRRVR